MKFAKAWYKLIDSCFMIITGYSILEASITVTSFSIPELLSIDKVGSIIVSIVAIGFWVSRFVASKKKDAKEQRLLDLEITIKEMKQRRLEMDEHYTELFEKEDEIRSNYLSRKR